MCSCISVVPNSAGVILPVNAGIVLLSGPLQDLSNVVEKGRLAATIETIDNEPLFKKMRQLKSYIFKFINRSFYWNIFYIGIYVHKPVYRVTCSKQCNHNSCIQNYKSFFFVF